MPREYVEPESPISDWLKEALGDPYHFPLGRDRQYSAYCRWERDIESDFVDEDEFNRLLDERVSPIRKWLDRWVTPGFEESTSTEELCSNYSITVSHPIGLFNFISELTLAGYETEMRTQMSGPAVAETAYTTKGLILTSPRRRRP